MNKPIIVSMGEPSGIAPEIAIKAWQILHATEHHFAIIGDAEPFLRAADAANIEIRIIADIAETAHYFPNALPILHTAKLNEKAILGRPSPKNAPAIIEAIKQAIGLVKEGNAKALVTLPIAKSVLYEAGFEFAGHTEFVAHEVRTMPFHHARGPVMMLGIDGLKVALVTIHAPISVVPSLLTIDKIMDVVRVVNSSLKNDFGIPNPRIALLGLNPHAGENGAIGREEMEIINPAAQLLREGGIDCSDALPADSAFSPHSRAHNDCFIAMYHDQGLIPIKALDFWGGVNVTLGLPIVRTSPDHGTGFDIAGKNIAKPDSLIAAIKMAADIADNRAKNNGK
ncbi:MAG: 4-hydroxythreonine-4-phosphate dehydrogenase [Hyphomonadaceae bacterium]|nr:MAG: 4-hydroxythreonine-4-phosphate dehydrogenase [Hyphomonadaceae bacterium]